MLGEGGSRGGCPGSASFALPAHAKEGAALQRHLLRSQAAACWLPLQGMLPFQLPTRSVCGSGACVLEPSSHYGLPLAIDEAWVCHVMPGFLRSHCACVVNLAQPLCVWWCLYHAA